MGGNTPPLNPLDAITVADVVRALWHVFLVTTNLWTIAAIAITGNPVIFPAYLGVLFIIGGVLVMFGADIRYWLYRKLKLTRSDIITPLKQPDTDYYDTAIFIWNFLTEHSYGPITPVCLMDKEFVKLLKPWEKLEVAKLIRKNVLIGISNSGSRHSPIMHALTCYCGDWGIEAAFRNTVDDWLENHVNLFTRWRVRCLARRWFREMIRRTRK